MEYTTTAPYRTKTTNPYTDGTGISLPILFNGANLFATSPLYRKGVWGIGNTLGLLLTKVPLTGGGFRGWVTYARLMGGIA